MCTKIHTPGEASTSIHTAAEVFLIPIAKSVRPSLSFEPARPSKAAAPAAWEIHAIQQRLSDLGYHEVGLIDGKMGSRTRGALAAFQAHEGLPITATINILPTGKRTYFVDYRNAAGARKRMTIGRRGRGAPKKASTLYVDRGRIARHIKPLLGKKLVKDVLRADVVKFMRDVATGKTAAVEKTKQRGKAVVEGGLGTSARTVGLLGSIMTFALGEGIIEQNPVAGVKKPADNKRDRRLTPDEYRRLGIALEQAKADAEV